MQVIFHAFVVYFIVYPIYLLLAGRSLEYYVAHNKISSSAIQAFLDELRFPFRGVYADVSNYNVFVTEFGKSIVKRIQSVSESDAMGARLSYAAVALLMICAIAVGLTKQTEGVWIAEHIFILSAHCSSFYLAWRFGHKISQMEKSLSSQKADNL
jgi:hypothetical protein